MNAKQAVDAIRRGDVAKALVIARRLEDWSLVEQVVRTQWGDSVFTVKYILPLANINTIRGWRWGFGRRRGLEGYDKVYYWDSLGVVLAEGSWTATPLGINRFDYFPAVQGVFDEWVQLKEVNDLSFSHKRDAHAKINDFVTWVLTDYEGDKSFGSRLRGGDTWIDRLRRRVKEDWS